MVGVEGIGVAERARERRWREWGVRAWIAVVRVVRPGGGL